MRVFVQIPLKRTNFKTYFADALAIPLPVDVVWLDNQH